MKKQSFDEFCTANQIDVLKIRFQAFCLKQLTEDEMDSSVPLVVWNRLYHAFLGKEFNTQRSTP